MVLGCPVTLRKCFPSRRETAVRFSERYGHKPIKSVLQTEGVDNDLKNALWSALKVVYWDTVHSTHDPIYPNCYLSINNDELNTLFGASGCTSSSSRSTPTPDKWDEAYQRAREFFFSCPWFEVYDFIEFVAQNYPDEKRNETFAKVGNTFLERELSAYRFVDRRVVRIVAPEEIEAIETAMLARPARFGSICNKR